MTMESDVEHAWLFLDMAVDTLKANNRPEARAALGVLKAAALDGAKVPGLVAELGDTRAAWHRETERADALQARVAELEAKVRNLRIDRDAGKGFLESAESERDALRAQVERAHDLLVSVRSGFRYDAVEQDRALMLARATLSATPAEAAPDTHRKQSATKRRQEALAAIAKHPPVVADDGAGTVALVWHDAEQKPHAYAVTTEQMRWMLGEFGLPESGALSAMERTEWSTAEHPSARPTCSLCGKRPCTQEHIFCRKCMDEVSDAP